MDSSYNILDNSRIINRSYMKQGGQTSNFKFITENNTKYFVKSWNNAAVSWNPQSLLFQDAMLNLDIPLKINKIISKDDNKKEAKFEYINEQQWDLDIKSARIIGESMAKIHNWSATSKIVKSLNIIEKNKLYNNMNDWDNLPKYLLGDNLHELKFTHEVYRKTILKNLKAEGIKPGVNTNQPKIATHRDFKKHNILSDGKDLHLIDFDFTAIDYVSLEIMSFIMDLIIIGYVSESKETQERDAKICIEFISTYKKHSKLNIIWESVVYDYLFYLISNTFPYSLPMLDDPDVIQLSTWRTIHAEQLFKNRKNLTKTLTL